jgi:CHAT domain-containing protein
MKIIDEVFNNMVESIKKTLPSFHSHKRKARIYAKRFLNGFSDNDREFIIKEILHQQNRSIIKAIGNKRNIAIPIIGTFQYRESLEIIRQIKNDVKRENNVEDLRKVDQETYDKLSAEIESRKKAIILPLYFKQIDNRDSTINYNFLKK